MFIKDVQVQLLSVTPKELIMNLYIMGRRPSKAVLAIVKKTGIPRYRGKKSRADVLVNYGLAGTHADRFYKQFPSARRIPTINKHIGHSKLSVVNRAGKEGIRVPESKLKLGFRDRAKNFIEKRTNSIGGIGIKQATHKKPIPGKYYQEFIKDRIYELRVHAFKWTDDWAVQKRVGPADSIAWNFKQGGHFITVGNPGGFKVFREAREISDQILDMLDMAFGAVDFIVDGDHNVYFIEINSAPGFTELSEHIYVGAFNELKDLSSKQFAKLT